MIKRFWTLLILFALAATVTGCGLIDYYFLPPPEDTAQELYEAGVDAMQDKDYGDAADYFTKLKDRYPFSPFTAKAEIGQGDAFFLDGKYALAADSYKEFEVLHPRHEETPYILFQIGLSNFKLFKSVDLRQQNIAEAIEYFNRVVDAYPKSDYAAEAKGYIAKSRHIMAEHEVYIADFFWRAENYGPAWNRYKYVVENFPDVPDVQNYARERAQFAYFEHQRTLSEFERVEAHKSWLNWIAEWF